MQGENIWKRALLLAVAVLEGNDRGLSCPSDTHQDSTKSRFCFYSSREEKTKSMSREKRRGH